MVTQWLKTIGLDSYAVSPPKHWEKVMFQHRGCLLSNCGVDKSSVHLMISAECFFDPQPMILTKIIFLSMYKITLNSRFYLNYLFLLEMEHSELRLYPITLCTRRFWLNLKNLICHDFKNLNWGLLVRMALNIRTNWQVIFIKHPL